ncbi:MAG: heme exporter protein CcmB [Rhodospirillaceae bacterium]|jgi:heme exporter protein B|nr:heme exporter protein CcmB [Rhodospirillaceae bacterium]MBT5375002.1 heme exporter protein CcmB [Rhodospirillaceae bacterium]MBT5751238.1 heme exporter protein CcmB [Rhodospirillaceae bacterium]
MTGFWIIVKRDLSLAWRQGGDGFIAIMFFLIAVTLFPLGIGPEIGVLARISAGVVWVSALLATLLSLERLFQADFEDGSLEQIAITPLPLEAVVLAKCVANWLMTGLPLLIIAPLLALMLHMETAGFWALMAGMALGTPILNLIGAIGAALTIGARRGGVLLTLLVLPLYIPVLIFGVGAVEATLTGLSAAPHLQILGGLLLLALPLGIIASAAALRQALE